MSQPFDAQFLQIEAAAHQGAHGHNPRALPTEAQHAAGNYKKGRTAIHGLHIAIEQPRGSYRSGRNLDGSRWATRLAAHYGYFEGVKGADGDELDCFVGFYPQAESIYIINQQVGGRFDEHKVMLCFDSQASAERAYRDSYERGWTGLHSVVAASVSQFKWWLKNGDKSRPMLPEHLPHEGSETMMNSLITWDASAQPVGMQTALLLYQIRCHDAGAGLLLDAVTCEDILEDADEVLAMDAMVTPYAKVERKMDALYQVMQRASATIKPIAVKVTEPFKPKGVSSVNVAGFFELSDGQTVSVYLHNPDTTPQKLAPTDELISWKWLLNKKDITIVVAPERGEDLNVREVARRIMKLAEKNSPAFQRVNAKRAERMQAIQGLKDEITALETELDDARKQLEAAKVEAANRAAKPVPSVDQRISDATFLQGVEEGSADMSNPESASRLAQIAETYKGDPNFADLLARALAAVSRPESAKPTAIEPIELTGKELGDFPDTKEGIKARREATRTYLEGSLKGRWIDVPAIGDKVEIRQVGIDESISWSANPKKLKALAVLDRIIAGSHSPDYQPNFKPSKKPSVLSYIHLKNSVMINGDKVDFSVIVERDLNGLLHYDIKIDAAKTKTALDSSSAASVGVILSQIQNLGFSPKKIMLDAAASVNGMVLNLFIEGEDDEVALEEVDIAPALRGDTRDSDAYRAASDELARQAVAAGAESMDPIKDYQAVRMSDALKYYFQDALDSAFGSRMVAVRNELRGMGWEGEQYKALSKNGATLDVKLEQVGAGRNVVGVTWTVTGNLKQSVDGAVIDTLEPTDLEMAQEIDAMVKLPEAVEPEPAQDEPGVSPQQPVDTDLEAIFAGLDGAGLVRKRSQEAADAHPLSEAIWNIQNQFTAILGRLEAAGRVTVN